MIVEVVVTYNTENGHIAVNSNIPDKIAIVGLLSTAVAQVSAPNQRREGLAPSKPLLVDAEGLAAGAKAGRH